MKRASRTGLRIMIALMVCFALFPPRKNGYHIGRINMIFQLRNLMCVALITYWGAAVAWRVIHARIRDWLLGSAFLMIFWLVIRDIKWELVSDVNVQRIIWYTPAQPYTIHVEEDGASYQSQGYCTLYVTSGGADNPRPVYMRQKGDKWYVWQTQQQLVSDIRLPHSEDKWAGN